MAKTKGTNLVEMVKFLRAQREASLELMPEPLRHYLDENVSVASWYPEEDVIDLVKVTIQLIPETDEDPLVVVGRINALQHVKGAYNHLFDSPELATLPIRANALWQSMHDSGEFRVALADGEATAEVTGYACPSPEMCVMIRPYIEELFHASGIEKVLVEKRACCLEGDSTCRYHVLWDSAEA